MKKHIIILAAFFAAALLVSGCNPENNLQVKSQGLTISLFCGEPETKADPEPDPFAFENTIDHFDFFFFQDAQGTQPIRGMHGRVVGNQKVLDTSENGEFSALRSGTSYVYILANYPGTINHSADHTLAQLKALDVNAPVITAVEKKENPINGDMEETGNVTYCDYLVMDSYQKATGIYTVKLTPQAIEEERTVTVELSRLTAKLDLIITVEPSVPGSMTYTDAGGTVHQEVWKPVLNDLHAYFVNALNNRSTVSAEPIQRSEIEDGDVPNYEYLTYPTLYAIAADASDDHKFTTAPAYTYPQVWDADANGEPYFKIQIPWESSLRGTTNFYYKIALPKSESNKRTIDRNMHYQVTVDLAVVDTENEYVELNGSYVVTPWLSSGWDGGSHVNPAQFFSVPVNKFEVFSQDTLLVPFYSSSTTKAYFTSISFDYFGGGAGVPYTFTFTEADNTTSYNVPTISGISNEAQDHNEYTLERDGNSWKLTHSVSHIYTKRTIQFVIKNEEGRSQLVTVVQHPAIEFESKTAKNFFVNGHFARATEGIHIPGKPGVKLGIPFTSKRGGDETGTGTLIRYHSDDRAYPGNSYSSHANNTQSYWFPGNANYEAPGYTTFTSAPQVQSLTTKGRYGWVTADGYRGIPYLIKLTVSAFNDDNNEYSYTQGGSTVTKKFVLGDPRVDGGSTFNELGNVNHGYLYRPSTVRESNDSAFPVGEADAVYKAWQSPGTIKMATTDANDGHLIAPRIILSSYYNGQPTSVTWETAKKRAATYQESGYPAGRWRLPTEAEIMFLVWCQQQGIISPVWANSTYWCADGRVVEVQNGGATVQFITGRTGAVNRFVYDLWYWGDDPMEDDEQYWPNGHLAKPNDITGTTFPTIN